MTKGATHERVQDTTPPHARAARTVGNTLLNLAAFGGVCCIVLVILAAWLNVSLVLFKTGSMSPTIPAGSLAVVREIPAPQINVGDVITVDRPGQLPVTHRVTSITGVGAERTLTMRGDANAAEDPQPYTIERARLVLGSVPHLAKVVVWFSEPVVLGALTLTMASLVTWAFWPNRAEGSDRAARLAPRRRQQRPRHSLPSIVVITLAAGVVAGSSMTWQSLPAAHAADSGTGVAGPVRTVTQGRYLTLTSIGDPAEMRAMRTAKPVLWQIGVQVDAPEPGRVKLTLSGVQTGEIDLQMLVQGCAVEWIGGTCATGARELGQLTAADLLEGAAPVATLGQRGELWLLLSATLREAAAGSLGVTLTASGTSEDVATGPLPIGPSGAGAEQPAARPMPAVGGELTRTGSMFPAQLALGSIVAGLLVAASAQGYLGLRRRRRVGRCAGSAQPQQLQGVGCAARRE